jgi:hypothetical protein
MAFFCSCRYCKINSINGSGRWLFTKKIFKKHQKKEKANTEKINRSETESDNKSISSCNKSEKRKFKDDELDKSDISSDNSLSYDDNIPKDVPKSN